MYMADRITRNLLVVDDNGMNRMVFMAALADLDLVVDEASSGAQCIEMACDKYYDMIFMDIMMPEMNGIETYKNLQANVDNKCANTPVVALTADGSDDMRKLIDDAGFADFLSKPVFFDDICDVMRKHIPGIDDILSPEVSDGETDESQLTVDDGAEDIILPDIDGFDWEAAQTHFKNRQVLWEFVRHFYKNYKSTAARIQRVYDSIDDTDGNSVNTYRIEVHALKSNAALFGNKVLSDMNRQLEEAAGSGDVSFIRRMHPAMMDEWERCMLSLSEYLTESHKELMFDVGWIFSMLSMLEMALEEMDYDKADAIMKDVMTYSYDEKIARDINELDVLISNLENAAAIAKIHDILAGLE